MAKRETLFKKKIRPLLDALPHSWWVKTQMVAIRGIPDFLGTINGHFVALELKTDEGEADELQKWHLQKIIKSGGLGLVVTPENWERTYSTLMSIAHAKIIFQPEEPKPEALLDG